MNEIENTILLASIKEIIINAKEIFDKSKLRNIR